MDLNQYIGIPFKELGRDLDGWDCWGCFRYIYREEFGIFLPSYTDVYETTEDHNGISKQVRRSMRDDWVKVDKPKISDGILFRIEGDPIHVAIVAKPNEMIHVCRGVDTCIENFTTSRWRSRLLGFYCHRDFI